MKSYEIGTLFYAKFVSNMNGINSEHFRLMVIKQENQLVGIAFSEWVVKILEELPENCILNDFKIVTP